MPAGALDLELADFQRIGPRLQRSRIQADGFDGTDDVDADRPDRGKILDFGVGASCRPQPCSESHVIVVVHHLVAGDRLEVIAAGERQYRFARGVGGIAAYVIEDRHVLFSAGPRGIERKVAFDPYLLLVFSLADAKRERRGAVLAVPAVSEVLSALARPEKIVRRWKCGDRSRRAELGDDDAGSRLQRRLTLVVRAAEPVRLRIVRRIAPREPCS